MPKTCQNCGKNQTVEINKKRYCVNCGDPVEDRQRLVTAKPAAKKPVSSASKTKTATSHVLDLSKVASPQAKPAAQMIHGRRALAAVKQAHQPRSVKTSSRSAHQNARQARAHQIKRHPQIQRFHSTPPQPVNASRPLPVQTMAPHHIYQVNTVAKPAASRHAKQPLATAKNPQTESIFSKLGDSLKYIFRRHQLAPTVAAIAVVLVLAAYITYLNVPSIGVRLAASRAGIDAQLPNYRPPGYSFAGLVGYSRGQIIVRFNDADSSQYLQLTQRQSQWDPQTLLEDYVTPKAPNYTQHNRNGLTIYLYNGNNAAWINNGYFYTLEGESFLEQEQILKMAASL